MNFLELTYTTLKKPITLSIAITLIVWTAAVGFWIHPVEGANLTSISDTLSDSDLNVASNHTIKFTSPTGVSAGEIIDYHFPTAVTEFSSSSIQALGIEDFDFVIGSSEMTVTSTFGGCAGASIVGVTTTISAASSTVRVEICTSNSVGASASTTLEIGTNATASSTGNSQITNPTSAASYEILIAGSQTDTGKLRVAIIDDVTVTATVSTSFTFTIAGINSSTACVGDTTDITSTATTIPFGTLTANTSSTACQKLTVSTNASNGFIVTVQADSAFVSGSGDDIDFFRNGDAIENPVSWTAPSSTAGSEATYGHWGVTTSDGDLATDTGSSTDSFGQYNYSGSFTSSSPRNIMGSTGPVNASTTDVGFTVEIGSLQEAGSDYTATLTYIATPTF